MSDRKFEEWQKDGTEQRLYNEADLERVRQEARLTSRLMGIYDGTAATLEEVWDAWGTLDKVQFTKWLDGKRKENLEAEPK